MPTGSKEKLNLGDNIKKKKKRFDTIGKLEVEKSGLKTPKFCFVFSFIGTEGI